MPITIKTLLRTQRRFWALTQKELARLLGVGERGHVSKLEHGRRAPNLKIAIGTQIIFGMEFKNMFPKFWNQVQERVVRRVHDFHGVVKHGVSRRSQRKRELAEAILRQALDALKKKSRNSRV